MANYALITILTVMIAALLLHIVQSYAEQTAARGTAILTVDALNMVLMAMLVFLVMRQVMPIASGLVGGASLVSYGVVSRSVGTLAARPAMRVASKGMSLAAASTGRLLGTTARNTGRIAAGRALLSAVALSRRWRKTRDE